MTCCCFSSRQHSPLPAAALLLLLVTGVGGAPRLCRDDHSLQSYYPTVHTTKPHASFGKFLFIIFFIDPRPAGGGGGRNSRLVFFSEITPK